MFYKSIFFKEGKFSPIVNRPRLGQVLGWRTHQAGQVDILLYLGEGVRKTGRTAAAVCNTVFMHYSFAPIHAISQYLFMKESHSRLIPGSCRSERAQLALSNIGPAVLNGGFSTFLSFILLADSNSHVFETFFKVFATLLPSTSFPSYTYLFQIFFLVVVFALYNGLVLLPVLLSLVGPGKQRELNEDLVQERQTADSDPIELNPLSAWANKEHCQELEGCPPPPPRDQTTKGLLFVSKGNGRHVITGRRFCWGKYIWTRILSHIATCSHPVHVWFVLQKTNGSHYYYHEADLEQWLPSVCFWGSLLSGHFDLVWLKLKSSQGQKILKVPFNGGRWQWEKCSALHKLRDFVQCPWAESGGMLTTYMLCSALDVLGSASVLPSSSAAQCSIFPR